MGRPEGAQSIATGRCYVCGSPGAPLHQGVVNWRTDGGLTYSFSRCQNSACGHAWLSASSYPAAVEAYPADYYTHAPAPAGMRARAVATIKRSRLGHALGYVMYLQGMTSGRVLEVGCGSGARLAEVAGDEIAVVCAS